MRSRHAGETRGLTSMLQIGEKREMNGFSMRKRLREGRVVRSGIEERLMGELELEFELELELRS